MKDLVYTPRVAMYIWHFPPFIGGAERQCERLSEELVKKGIAVFVITERISHTRSYEVLDHVPVYRVSSLNWLRDLPNHIRDFFYFISKKRPCYDISRDNRGRLRILKSISKVLTHTLPNYYFFLSSLWTLYRKRDDFDIIHVHEAHWIGSFGVKIARLLNKKVIVKEAISSSFMTFNEQSFGSKKSVMQAALFIAISDEIFDNLVSLGISRDRIRKIPNGIGIDGDKWLMSHDKEKIAICITKLNQLPNKGIDILLKAWEILIHRYEREIRLSIFGPGKSALFNKLVHDFNLQNYVDFGGFIDNVKENLLNSYVFILPSRGEGMSNALLEAMSLGMPCIATDISGNRDLIQDGINGLLVPSGDPEALVKKALFILDNPEKARVMGFNARRTIEQGYEISAVAYRYGELYKDLMDSRRNRY